MFVTVSYTHLDVYKRQGLCRQAVHLTVLKLIVGFRVCECDRLISYYTSWNRYDFPGNIVSPCKRHYIPSPANITPCKRHKFMCLGS